MYKSMFLAIIGWAHCGRVDCLWSCFERKQGFETSGPHWDVWGLHPGIGYRSKIHPAAMKRQVPSQVLSHVLILGLVGGVLIAVLRWSEYQFLVIEHSFEIYAALVAIIFAGFGIWLGIKLTKPREKIILREVFVATDPATTFTLNRPQLDALGITPRELEILTLIAQGLSNREIATRLFVSENTVKTHCSRAFDKLGARRRTQAVQLGKQLGILP